MRHDLILRGGRAVIGGRVIEADIGIRDGRVSAVGAVPGSAAETVEVRGLVALPGLIDGHVHFREPGAEHKEDLATGTAAAALGGVTAVLEMPNTNPPTTTAEALADKVARARGRAWVDHAFFVGATGDNLDALAELEALPGAAGVKLFMGSSTGTLLVADAAGLRAVLGRGRRRVAVHAEDEARLRERRPLAEEGAHPGLHPTWRDVEAAVRATRRLLDAAEEAGRPVHVLHLSTAEEVELLRRHRHRATCEVTPQHLTLVAPECYERLGTKAQLNPPIREARHREALWRAVRAGLVDAIASDHAPHTLAEKARPYPASPSGLPGVQTMLPLMLEHVAAGRLDLPALARLGAEGPARVWGIAGKGRIAPGMDADLVLVDPRATRRIEDDWIASRCGWTPFAGMRVRGWPVHTLLRGAFIVRDEALVGPPRGRLLRFAGEGDTGG